MSASRVNSIPYCSSSSCFSVANRPYPGIGTKLGLPRMPVAALFPISALVRSSVLSVGVCRTGWYPLPNVLLPLSSP